MRVLGSLVIVSLTGLAAACDIKVGKDGGVSVDVASGRASDEWRRTYSLTRGGRLEIINVNGRIEAFPASGTQIEVVATREVRTRTEEEAKARLASAEMLEDVGPNHVKIEARSADQGGSFGSSGRVVINYRLSVPAGLATSLRTENGAVRLENIDGDITIASTNGPIVAHGLRGSVDASTVNGGIEIGLESIAGDSTIVTVNGPATLTVSPAINAELEAAAINGGVIVQDGLPLTTRDRTNRRVAGRLNDGGPRISVQTTNGGVRVGVTGVAARGRMRGRPAAPAGG
jgi:hypothetical protein